MRPGAGPHVRPFIRCPYCHATGSSRFVCSPGNLLKVVLNGTFALAVGEPLFPLNAWYKCTHCAGRFTVARRQYEPPHCRVCGYDLTGNTSGICPECGRPIDPHHPLPKEPTPP